MSPYPQKIHQISDTELRIEWSDNHCARHTMVMLRSNCPCATCRAEVEAIRISTVPPGSRTPKYDLAGIEVVGSYALQIAWRDGHRTGIYPYELLRRICECEACQKGAKPENVIT